MNTNKGEAMATTEPELFEKLAAFWGLVERTFPGYWQRRLPADTPRGWAFTTYGCATYWHLPAGVFDRLSGGRVEDFENGHKVRLFDTDCEARASLAEALTHQDAMAAMTEVYPAHTKYEAAFASGGQS